MNILASETEYRQDKTLTAQQIPVFWIFGEKDWLCLLSSSEILVLGGDIFYELQQK